MTATNVPLLSGDTISRPYVRSRAERERCAAGCNQQLVDEIKTLIARGELEEGTLLPPVRQVASDLGVNLNTVAFAYRRLQKEGLIRVKHGSGAVVISQTLADKPDDRLRAQLRTALTQLILAGSNSPRSRPSSTKSSKN
jgi:GntR family transcriptional regulator